MAAVRVTRPVAGFVRVIVTVSPIECSSSDRGVSRSKSKLLSASGRAASVTIADCGNSVSTTSSMTSVTAAAGRSTVRVSVIKREIVAVDRHGDRVRARGEHGDLVLRARRQRRAGGGQHERTLRAALTSSAES